MHSKHQDKPPPAAQPEPPGFHTENDPLTDRATLLTRQAYAVLYLIDRMRRTPLFPPSEKAFTLTRLRRIRELIYHDLGVASAHKFIEHIDRTRMVVTHARATHTQARTSSLETRK